jgi:hypothetical protein
VISSLKPQPAAPHHFLLAADPSQGRIDLTVQFTLEPSQYIESPATLCGESARAWSQFWRGGAAVDFTGSTNPLAK